MRYCHKCRQVFFASTCYSCQVLMNFNFRDSIFEKYSNKKFGENPSSGSRIVPDGRADRQTDRHTDMTKLTVDFRNFVKAPKN